MEATYLTFKLKHLHVKAPDSQKAATWWVENLGATVSRQAGSSFTLDLHGVQLVITGFMDGQKRTQKMGLEHIAISTGDLRGLVNRLKANGGHVVDEVKGPAGPGAFFVETPEGVQLELSEET